MLSRYTDTLPQFQVSNRRGVVVGLVVLITAVAALISARSIPFFFAVVIGAFLIATLLSNCFQLPEFRNNAVSWSLAAFLGYGLISASWAIEPTTTLTKILLAAAIVLAATWMVQQLSSESGSNLARLSEGLWIGFAIGLIYSFIEIASDQAIKIWLYNALGLGPDVLTPKRNFEWLNGRLVKISSYDMTRNATPITLMMWPAIMAALATLAKPWNRIAVVLIVIVALTTVAISTHETSKLAIVAGGLVFALSHLSLKWTGRLLMAGWIFVCLAILPTAFLAHRLDLHNAKWLQSSAQHRIIIWNHTAEQTMQAPIFGRGAEMTYVIGPRTANSTKSGAGEAWTRKLSIHAHNIYLQTWFELGLAGALLLTAVGITCVRAIADLPDDIRRYAYATFACGVMVAGSSYGMWQGWFMAMFALAWVCFAIGSNALRRSGDDQGEIPAKPV